MNSAPFAYADRSDSNHSPFWAMPSGPDWVRAHRGAVQRVATESIRLQREPRKRDGEIRLVSEFRQRSTIVLIGVLLINDSAAPPDK